jgi:hypothetical protein
MERPVLTITIPLPTIAPKDDADCLDDLITCIQNFTFSVSSHHNVPLPIIPLPLLHGAMKTFVDNIATTIAQPYIDACRSTNPSFSTEDPQFIEGSSIGKDLFDNYGPTVGMKYRTPE